MSGEREAPTAFRFYGRFLSSVNDREPTKVGVRSRSDTLEFLQPHRTNCRGTKLFENVKKELL